MKWQTIFLLTTSLMFYQATLSQENIRPEFAGDHRAVNTSGKELNFFVISKRKKGKIDPATWYNMLRAKIKSTVRPKRFVAIVAPDAHKASEKIIYRLQKYHAMAGTIWFDSHGMYKKGYSLFLIGHDEISYKTIKDSAITAAFEKIAAYATDKTQVVIGSCYGGATYSRASIDYKDTTRMNGDSLMMALGKIFKHAKVYASESWVMTKPGIFNEKKIAVTGYPKRKLFHDVCYRPAWENAGKWNMYNAVDNTLYSVNPVTMDSYGNLHISRLNYTAKKDAERDIEKNIKKLGPDLYK